MSKIKIATDSTADIPKSFCEERNISVLPLTILADEKEYRDGVDINPAEFYKGRSSTACPSVGNWLQASGNMEEVYEAKRLCGTVFMPAGQTDLPK